MTVKLAKRVLVALVLVLASVPVGAAAPSWSRHGGPIGIPERNPTTNPYIATAEPYPSRVVINTHAAVKSVTVSVEGLEHEEISDVEILLVNPTEKKKVVLMAYVGQGTHEKTPVTYTFDDNAPKGLPKKHAAPTGTYRPTSYRNYNESRSDAVHFVGAPKPPYESKLAAFNGTDPYGWWTLYVIDTLDHFGGKIAGWTLRINGDEGEQKPLCEGRPATIVGSGTIKGTPGDDVIYASVGPDRIDGLDGDDYICGLEGNDRIDGGRGDDHIDAAEGDNGGDGGPGNDYIKGGDEDDRFDGGAGNDRLFGGPGNDYLYGGSGNDDLEAGSGNDFLAGMKGTDKLYGQDGNDYLRGGPRGDLESGSDGTDKCEQDGHDTLLGCEKEVGPR